MEPLNLLQQILHCAFDKAEKDSLTMQDDIYKKYSLKVGILLNRQKPQKIQKVKQNTLQMLQTNISLLLINKYPDS